MQSIAEALRAYLRNHPFDPGNSDAETVLDQLYQAYAHASIRNDPNENTRCIPVFLPPEGTFEYFHTVH